jgi:MFS family permease
LTPTYAAIGIAAPILAVLFRLLQGFALGGELGPTTAYLLESAAPERRGFITSLQFATQDFAAFLASIVGFILASLLTDAALDAWGWRLAFLLGASVVPIGLIIRRALPETLHQPEPDLPARAAQSPSRVAMLAFLIFASATVAGYVQTNLINYASSSLHLTTQVAFGIAVSNTFFTALFDPVGGCLTDQFGRKPIMIIGTVALIAATLPVFYVMANYSEPTLLYVVAGFLGALTGIAQPPAIIAATEALPKRVRAGTIAVVYALAISMFGGLTPFVATWLTETTHNPLAPGWYMALAGLLGLIAMALLRETAPRRLSAA